MKHDNLNVDRLKTFVGEASRVAALFFTETRKAHVPITIVHHNDADGIAAAAALSHAFGMLGMNWRLLPVEKVHAPVVEKIHAMAGGIILYADLGGQSSGLISTYAAQCFKVIILDHHLPGAEVSGNVIHLNPECFGISGDVDASGASVCALFSEELLKEASLSTRREEALLALMGVIGAVGDGQKQAGALTGVNWMLLNTAIKQGEIKEKSVGYVIPRFDNKSVSEIVEVLNLLGSVGFYSGRAETGVDLLLGRDSKNAFRIAEQLGDLKTSHFTKEAETIRGHGLASSAHFQWVDVKDRFDPMGVKAIGLFLEYLIMKGKVAGDKYIIGFQHLPAEMPGIGLLEGSLTKISARVPPTLKESIQQGRLPDFMTLIPQAADRVQGTADGCHRFAAAALITQGREAEFLEALEEVIKKVL